MQPILEDLETTTIESSKMINSNQDLASFGLRNKIYSRASRTATISRRRTSAYSQVLLSQNRYPALEGIQESVLNGQNADTQYTYGANFNTNFSAQYDPTPKEFRLQENNIKFSDNKRKDCDPEYLSKTMDKNMQYRMFNRMRPSVRRHVSRYGEIDSFPPSNLIRLFGESSVPGVRDIALSRSFLRRLFWIVSFFFFGFLALRDISQLVSEYYTYPITVDVRLRDSRRLQFPAVTVCNLNIVRYSALCITNVSVIKDSMIPRDLRNKLCGFQPSSLATSGVSPSSTTTSNIKQTSTPAPSIATTSAKQDSINKNTKTPKPTKKSSTTTMSSRTKANSTTQNGITSTTVVPTDNNEGIDDINNYGVLSKDKHKLLGNETVPGNGTADIRLFNKTIADIDNKTSTLDIDNKTSTPTTKAPVTKTTVKLVKSATTKATTTKNPEIPTELAMPMPNSTAHTEKPKRRIKPMSTKTGAVNTFEQAANFTASNGNNYHNASLPNENPPSKQTQKSPENSVKPGQKAADNPINQQTPPLMLDNDIELTEREEKELQENLTNWLAVIYNSNEKITKELGHQFEDLVLRCTIRSTNCTHANSFEHFFTPTEGNCFTFKSQKLRKTYLEKIKDETSIAGVNYGLELVLNLEISEYLTGSAQIGAIIMIQHPDEIGNSASEAIFVAPQQSTYIGLKMVNISRLPKPYPEECIDHWPAALIGRLTQNASYSQQTCLKICLQRTIHTRCDCQSAMLPQLELNSTLKICDTRRKHTRNCVEEVMFQAEEKVSTCKCPPRCQVVNYDKTVSMTRWPTREDKVTFDRGRANINFQNLAKVTVYFQTMTCQEVRQEKAYTTAKLFSSLGGILGMYVGFSFLSLFEILEVFVRRFWYLVTKKRSRFRAAVHTVTATLALNSKRPTVAANNCPNKIIGKSLRANPLDQLSKRTSGNGGRLLNRLNQPYQIQGIVR